MNKRDEIQQAIVAGISEAVPYIDEHDDRQLIERIMHNLDSLVEQWTDEETAEDLDKSIGKSEVYEGMRVRTIEDMGFIKSGSTGTVVHPDADGLPGVFWDNSSYNQSHRHHAYGEYCYHVHTEYLEEE